jgi:hypothetical protein
MSVAELDTLPRPIVAGQQASRPRPLILVPRGLAEIEAAENAGRALRFTKAPLPIPAPRRPARSRLRIFLALVATALAATAAATVWWALAAR